VHSGGQNLKFPVVFKSKKKTKEKLKKNVKFYEK